MIKPKKLRCNESTTDSMKLIRIMEDGIEKVGILEKSIVTALSCSMIDALNVHDIRGFGEEGSYPLDEMKIEPPISPSKIICIGLNYKDHATELNMELPDEPIIFLKPSTSVIGHLDDIIYPDRSNQLDYECELGVVISKEAKNVRAKDAEDFIGGYTVLNDVTARDLQRKDVQWTRAKSFDTFCPIGPCIETDLNSNNQNISLKLNGEIKQKSNTKNMIFNVYELVEFISNIMTLKPGDIIATGTPPGVGPMNVGDVVEAEVEGIGILKNLVKN